MEIGSLQAKTESFPECSTGSCLVVRPDKNIHGTFLKAGCRWNIPCSDLVGATDYTTWCPGGLPQPPKAALLGAPWAPGAWLPPPQVTEGFCKSGQSTATCGDFGWGAHPRAHGSQLQTPHCKPEREAAAQRAGPFPSTQQVRSHPDTTAEQVACRLKRAFFSSSLSFPVFFFFLFSFSPSLFSSIF